MEVECEQRLTRLEESTKSAHHRIDEVVATQSEIRQLAISVNSLASSIEQQAKSQEKMQQTQEEIAKRISEIELKPAKRWDQVTMLAIAAIVAAIMGYALGKIF